MEPKISLTLPLGVVNLVLTTLAEKPFSQVADAILMIRAQAQPQVAPPPAPPAAAAE